MSAESFASATVLEGRGDVLGVEHGTDRNFVVQFYTREVEDERETRMRGRVVVKPVAFCRKYAVGDTKTVWDQPANDIDKARWPQEWAAYERGEEESIVGTPLEAWPVLNRDMRFALKNAGFKTVEQIASITDGALSGMGSNIGNLVHRVKAHAEKFIAEQEAGEGERRLMDQLSERDAEIESLKNQMAALAQQVERANEDRLAAPISPPEETGPGFRPITEDIVSRETPTLDALGALPELEEELPEPVIASRKLSAEQIEEIRNSTETQAVLAERYGVSKPTIARYRK